MSADTTDLRAQALEAKKYLVDPYQDWIAAEGVPVHTGRALDLTAVDLAPWRRFGMRGAACHVEGRCDFLTCFVFALEAGQSSAPTRKVYEECVHVLSGAGRTLCTLSDGRSVEIAWRAGDMFSPPINATCVHMAAPEAPARLASLNDLRYLMGLYRNEAFLFANGAGFAQRQQEAVQAGLYAPARGLLLERDEEGASAALCLAAGSIGCDLRETPAGIATLARRQMQGAHLLCLSGEGFTLSFDDDSGPLTRTEWRRGVLIGLPSMSFHPHFSGRDAAARFAKIELGSLASPIFRSRRAAYGDETVYASGSAVIPRAKERAEVVALRGQ